MHREKGFRSKEVIIIGVCSGCDRILRVTNCCTGSWCGTCLAAHRKMGCNNE